MPRSGAAKGCQGYICALNVAGSERVSMCNELVLMPFVSPLHLLCS